MNRGRCRKPEATLGLNVMNAGGTDSCTAAYPLGVVVGQLERGEDGHVVGDDVGALDAQDIEEGERVMEQGLPFDMRIVGHRPARPAQVGADDPVAVRRDGRSHGAPLPPMLGEPVQQHDRFALADDSHVSTQTRGLDDEVIEASHRWHLELVPHPPRAARRGCRLDRRAGACRARSGRGARDH